MGASVDQVQNRLRGVAAGLLTPFDEERAIDHGKLAENASTLYDEGIRTFLAAANISEYHSLSRDERVAVVETSVDALPDDACVLAGVGGSTASARELVGAYEARGVDAMMIMPPDHTYIHEQGLLDYYRHIGAATEQPLVPYVRGFDPSIDYLADLSHLDCVAGIKYAIEDPVKLWAEGIEGFSAGVSNFRPEVGLELFEALRDENWERARALRDLCLPYQQFRETTGADNTITGAMSVPAVKKGLELAGMHGGHVREPIRPLGEDEHRRAEELYADLDAGIDRLID
jgi:4-hydroxy-tetrahydrodipicolinate synthase